MAVAPLFVADMDTLKTRVRLQGASLPGALAVIDQAVEDARLLLYRRLGASRITQILATAYTETPATDAELERSLANSVELKIVRQDLLRKLTGFAQAGGAVHQMWNDENAMALDALQKRQEIERLGTEIEEGLAALAGDKDLDNTSRGRVALIGPTTPTNLPGASIWPDRRGENRA